MKFNKALRIIIAIFISFIIFGVFLSISGYNYIYSLKNLFYGSWGSANSIIESIVKAIPIMLCAYAVAIPGRLGLINLGADGQLIFGALGAFQMYLLFPNVEKNFLLLLMMIGGILGGVIWAVIPGILKGIFKTNEIVVSLLMNYIANYFLFYLINGPWKDPNSFGWPQSIKLKENAQLYHLFSTRIDILIIFALIFAIILYVIYKKTIIGFSSDIIKNSYKTANYVKINIVKYYILSFVIAGLFAGLAGYGELTGIQLRIREGLSLNYGYAGFLASWLCRHKFEYIPFTSFFLGSLLTGSDVLQIKIGTPFATINILQGLIFLIILITLKENNNEKFSN